MLNDVSIVGGKVLFGTEKWQENATVNIADGKITDQTTTTPNLIINAEGLLVLPGIIDLHGDAFERQLMPRPGVHFSHSSALIETDNQMIANGITTAYHGLTYSWEPGLRGAEAARAFVSVLNKIRPRLNVDTKLHLRYETYNLAAEPEITKWIENGSVDLLAFNDHLLNIEERVQQPERLASYAGRAGLDSAQFIELLNQVKSGSEEVPLAIARLAAKAREFNVPMASHDDESPEDRAWFEDIGCQICEFPVDDSTALYAMQKGDPVIVGAPNVMRGGSHCGRLSAANAIQQGLANILTSDYYYPAQLLATFKLASDGICDLATAWSTVSSNPAKAVGKTDRGEIAPGKRADIILVDNSDPELPVVTAALVEGKLVYTKDISERMKTS